MQATGGGGEPLPERDILEGFERLIAADRLFGAELNPSVIKKSGKGTPFLVRRPPSHHRMLALWRDLFANRVSPQEFLVAQVLAPHGFTVIPLAWQPPGHRRREEYSPLPRRGVAAASVGRPGYLLTAPVLPRSPSGHCPKAPPAL